MTLLRSEGCGSGGTGTVAQRASRESLSFRKLQIMQRCCCLKSTKSLATRAYQFPPSLRAGNCSRMHSRVRVRRSVVRNMNGAGAKAHSASGRTDRLCQRRHATLLPFNAPLPSARYTIAKKDNPLYSKPGTLSISIRLKHYSISGEGTGKSTILAGKVQVNVGTGKSTKLAGKVQVKRGTGKSAVLAVEVQVKVRRGKTAISHTEVPVKVGAGKSTVLARKVPVNVRTGKTAISHPKVQVKVGTGKYAISHIKVQVKV